MRYQELLERSQKERKTGLKSDQFFTRPEVAKQFAEWVKNQPFYDKVETVIEPSAGNMDIARHFPGASMYDLEPKHPNIKQQDWLEYSHEGGKNALVVGNPPFGKNNKLAIQFINKAAEFAEWIAFILPAGFKRLPTQYKIANTHSLYSELDLPEDSFYLPHEEGGKPYRVPAVAQIWHRKPRKKEKISYDSQWVRFVSPSEADVAIKRASPAGKLDLDKENWKTHRPRQYYYIKILKDRDKVMDFIESFDWKKMSEQTVGAPVISKFDVINQVNTNLT